MTEQTISAKNLVQLHVTGEAMRLLLTTEDGRKIAVEIPTGLDREIVHIMADALRTRSGSEFDPVAGHLLVHAHIQPARVERAISPLGLQEKFVLQVQSAGSTAMTYRLSEESAQKWVDQMQVYLAAKRKPTLSS